MPSILQPEFKWVASFNNALNLAVVQSVVPAYQNKPMIIQSRGNWNLGNEFDRADKGSAVSGFESFFWLIPVMGVIQYDYIQDTYTVGGTSFYGPMTVRTRSKGDDDTFANYSAMLRLPQPYRLQRKQDAYLDVRLTFIVEAAL